MLAIPAQPPAGAGKPPGTAYSGAAFTFNKITEGLHHAVGTGSLVVMSNAAIFEARTATCSSSTRTCRRAARGRCARS